MTIKRKSSKNNLVVEPEIEEIIENIILRGGKTSGDAGGALKSKINKNLETRFTLRLPRKLIERIDEARKLRPGIISRNQWILEILSSQLDSVR